MGIGRANTLKHPPHPCTLQVANLALEKLFKTKVEVDSRPAGRTSSRMGGMATLSEASSALLWAVGEGAMRQALLCGAWAGGGAWGLHWQHWVAVAVRLPLLLR